MGSAARKIEKAPPQIIGDYTIDEEGSALAVGGLRVTPELIEWLRAGHDDGEPALVVAKRRGGKLVVRRSDGRPLSDRERREVFGLAAAHYLEPLPSRPTPEEIAESLS